MGGKLLCNTKAEQVLVEDGKAVGVIANGARITADAVITASDTMMVNDLFEKPLSSPWLEEMIKNTEPTMNVLISFGIDADLSHYPRAGICKLNAPLTVGSQSFEYIVYTNYARDPVYSPKGKTALTISLPGDTYDYWKHAKESGHYKEAKKNFTNVITETLAEIIPETRGKVEMCDVATPLTYERYCGNWKGSWMTGMTADMKMTGYPAVIVGLNGVYFAGHRMSPPGGLPPALQSGRTAVQYLCRDTGTIFISEED